MAIEALTSAIIGANVGRIQLAVAARLLHVNADTARSAVKVIAAAEQSLDRLANVAAGVGTQIDVST